MHATYTRLQAESIYSTSKGAWAKLKIILYFTSTYGHGGIQVFQIILEIKHENR